MSAEETLEWLDSLEGEALEKALKSIKPPLEDELRELLDKRINLSVEKIIRNEGMFEADDEDPAKPKEK